MLESRKMTQQIDWWAKQPSWSHVACISEDLKCCNAWDTTCRHKAKDTTPSIASRRGTERSAWWSSSKGWRRAIISKTNTQTVSKAMLGELLRDGVPHIQAFLSMQVPSWTELNWRDGDKHAGYLFTVITIGGGGSQQSKFISTQNALCCSIANCILLHVVQFLHQSSETTTVGPLSDTTSLLILLF